MEHFFKNHISNEKRQIIYWISTGLFSLMILSGAAFYFLSFETVSESFTKLGFPTYLIIPLGITKVLGVTAIISKKSELLKEWAYSGFFFNLMLAVSAHLAINDGEAFGAILVLLLLITSYYFEKRASTRS